MTASTMNHSAYPPEVADLLPRARQLTEKLGDLPSQRQLKTELKVGAEKAKAVRQALERAAPGPGATVLVPIPETTPDPIPSPETTPEITRSAVPPVLPDLIPVPETAPRDHLGPIPGTGPRTIPAPAPETTRSALEAAPSEPVIGQVTEAAGSASSAARTVRTVRTWPVLVLALPAFVAIWSGWVGLGGLTGFGVVHPLPGIADGVSLNTAITLPIGVETYAAYALRVWLSGQVPTQARRFAKWSAIGSLVLGAAGQVAYHLMVAAGVKSAPWQITTLVSCLPVAVLGMGAALAHLVHRNDAH